ncbi:putative autophagy-related protein 11 [Paralichthys olivaceus]|uniref:putative autophagy-related protein 11 n=1 Tax=Paralichthys olivaceus TaxID=8255 RepID=UPI003752084E
MSANKVDLLKRAILEDTKSYLMKTAQYAKNVEDSDSKIVELDEAIAAKERHIIQLEDLRKKEKAFYEMSLNLMKLQLTDANSILAEETKHNQENSHAVSMSTTEMREIEREVTERDTHLDKCKRFKDILFKMASLMHKEAFILSLTHSNSKERMEVNVSEELMELVKNLSEQNLANFNATDKRKETLDECQTNLKKMKEKGNYHKEDLELTKMQDMINKVEGRLSTLKRLVAFTPCLPLGQDNIEWDALSRKVKEVYESCIGGIHGFNTTAMLCKIECHVLSLLDQLDSLPQDTLKRLRRLINADRVKKNIEENLNNQRIREKETKEKCLKRMMSNVKKRTGRKLLSRSMILEEDNTKDINERPQTPEEICWDKEIGEKEEESAVAALWEDWRLTKEAKLAKQCKKKEKRAAMSQPTQAGPKFGAVALRIPSANTKQPLRRLFKPELPKINSSNYEETSIIELQQTCPALEQLATASSNKLNEPGKAENLSTLLRMRRLN